MDFLKTLTLSQLSKLNFALKRNPKIIRSSDTDNYIPSTHNAVLLIQADFELAWAWKYSKRFNNSPEEVIKKGITERQNIPVILNICAKYNIPITWATVGHLLIESCSRNNSNMCHKDIKRLTKFENEFWKFDGNDWFDEDPCTNYKISPAWYAPDLVKEILESNENHEIGCHTFSHIDCTDEICSEDVFDSEIIACKIAAKKFDIDYKSFVHPAHTIGNLEQLYKHGFTSYRTDKINSLGYPIRHSSGLWEIQNTASLYYRENWSLNYHIYRYKKIIDRAIKTNTVCCLWFHPSIETKFIEIVFTALFKYIDSKREEILVSTTEKYIDWLNNCSSNSKEN